MASRGDIKGTGGIALAYNNVSSRTGKRLDSVMVPLYGGLPRVDGCPTSYDLVEALSVQALFNDLLDFGA